MYKNSVSSQCTENDDSPASAFNYTELVCYQFSIFYTITTPSVFTHIITITLGIAYEIYDIARRIGFSNIKLKSFFVSFKINTDVTNDPQECRFCFPGWLWLRDRKRALHAESALSHARCATRKCLQTRIKIPLRILLCKGQQTVYV